VRVPLDGVGVRGERATCPLLWAARPDLCFDARGCGFAGTAVCVELLDAEELEGVGEEGREGVGVTDMEEIVCALVLGDGGRWVKVSDAGVGLGGGGADDVAGGGGSSRAGDARCCSCRDESDVARRCEYRSAN
jgi:hypothetical protein